MQDCLFLHPRGGGGRRWAGEHARTAEFCVGEIAWTAEFCDGEHAWTAEFCDGEHAWTAEFCVGENAWAADRGPAALGEAPRCEDRLSVNPSV